MIVNPNSVGPHARGDAQWAVLGLSVELRVTEYELAAAAEVRATGGSPGIEAGLDFFVRQTDDDDDEPRRASGAATGAYQTADHPAGLTGAVSPRPGTGGAVTAGDGVGARPADRRGRSRAAARRQGCYDGPVMLRPAA